MLTNYSSIQAQAASYNPAVMDLLLFNYEIVLAPNATQDSPAPDFYAQQLTLPNVTTLLQTVLSAYDATLSITTREIRRTTPLFA